MYKTLKFFIVVSVAFTGQLYGQTLHVSRMFTDHVVLQRDQKVPVWGKAKPKSTITVSIDKQKVTAKAGADSSWMAWLAPMPAGGPYELVVAAGKESAKFSDVLVGEVIIASGQSNMEWKLRQPVKDNKVEIENAVWPKIRYFDIKNTYRPKPLKELADFTAMWTPITPETAPDVSAVAYFYARELYKDKKIPVGLILTEWGGTPAEAWTSQEALKAMGPDFDEAIEELTGDGPKLQEIRAKNRKLAEEYVKAIFKLDEGSKPEGGKFWTDADYNLKAYQSKWIAVNVPGKWESNGLPGYDGVGYYRRNFSIKELPSQPSAVLYLGQIDDQDSVWVNGRKIGGGEGWDKQRAYTVPTSLLKTGDNVVVVKVFDTGGDGGIMGQSTDVRLDFGNCNTIALHGGWYLRAATDMKQLPPRPDKMSGQNAPSVLFNAMINPIIPYAFKNVIWYQGESNAPRAKQYQRLFPTMINDWRKRWGQGDFPFLFVQLANYKPEVDEPKNSEWAELREAQTMTLSLPNTGMACIIDIGEANDIHPRNKQDVGLRLYKSAKKVVYGQDVVHSGPTYKEVSFNGSKALVRFNNTGGKPLQIKDKYGYLKGFELAGEDGKFYYAQARLLSEVVELESANVPKPRYVRYAWADNPGKLDLYNAEGLPAVPFRTDNFSGITK